MTIDRSTTLPPQWSEPALRLFLKPEDRESVPGDLLEEYRLVVRPGHHEDRRCQRHRRDE